MPLPLEVTTKVCGLRLDKLSIHWSTVMLLSSMVPFQQLRGGGSDNSWKKTYRLNSGQFEFSFKRHGYFWYMYWTRHAISCGSALIMPWSLVNYFQTLIYSGTGGRVLTVTENSWAHFLVNSMVRLLSLIITEDYPSSVSLSCLVFLLLNPIRICNSSIFVCPAQRDHSRVINVCARLSSSHILMSHAVQSPNSFSVLSIYGSWWFGLWWSQGCSHQ